MCITDMDVKVMNSIKQLSDEEVNTYMPDVWAKRLRNALESIANKSPEMLILLQRQAYVFREKQS